MLDANRELRVTEEEAHSVLLRLPRLHQLDLEGTATAGGTLRALRAAAPHLDPAGLLTPAERPPLGPGFAAQMLDAHLEPRWP